MDVDAIYKGNKLYKIGAPFKHFEKTGYIVPENYNGVSILYEYETAAALPDDLAAFLVRFTEGGMKLSPSQVLTANMCYTDISLQKLAEQHKSRAAVIFGLQWLEGLKNTHIRRNQMVKLYGMNVLVTDTLDVINTNDAAKKAFWAELKKLL